MDEPSTSGTKDHQGQEISVVWADIENSATSSSGESDGEGTDNLKYTYFKNPIFESPEEEACSCLTPSNLDSALDLLKNTVHSKADQRTYCCHLDNCVRSLNYIFKENLDKPISPYKVAATDYFFRFRHEFLFKFLCLSYNLEANKSDKKFSDFGIITEKDRTPDLIIDLNGSLIIIEVTAVSSFERAAQSKGIEVAGFESKYQREISIMNEKGIKNTYIPVFFNMGDLNEPINRELLKPLDLLFQKNISYSSTLRVVARNFSLLTNEFKKYFITSATVLFSKGVEIVSDHKDHEFLYQQGYQVLNNNGCKKKNTYRSYTVSPNVYNKINNNWDRLPYILENSSIIGYPANFIVSSSTRKISFEKSTSGLLPEEWLQIIDNQDKFKFFKNLKIRIGTRVINATDSDNGLIFYDRTEEKDPNLDFTEMQLFIDHPTITYMSETQVEKSYIDKCNAYDSQCFHSVHYDELYEDKIINSILDNDKKYKGEIYNVGLKEDFLGLLQADDIDINGVMGDIKESYITENTESSLPLKVMKMKSPFILPIADINGKSYCGLKDKNIGLINCLIKELVNSNPYTALILQGVIDSKFELYSKPNMPSKDLKSLYDARVEISIRINYLQTMLNRKTPGSRISKTSDPEVSAEFKELKSRSKSIGANIKKLEKVEKVKNVANMVRLPTKNKNSDLRRSYEKEMTHFKNKKIQSTIEGVGIRSTLEEDFEADKEVFDKLSNFLCVDKGENPDLFIDLTETEDSKLLKDLKEAAKSDYKDILRDVTRSSLGHSAALISRISHSLMFYSQMPFSSDYIKVDNLGYKNVLIMIKGGKKIFKSRASKLFRLVYPIPECLLPWYQKGHINKGSTIIFEYQGASFAVTPWSMLHESILTESISFYPRVCSFAVLNSRPEISFRQQFHRFSLNVVLSFHDRRQTEVLLANLRYIMLSTLGDYTGVSTILKEFFSFNYDCFQAFVRGCVLFNYPQYFKGLVLLKGLKKDKGKDITISDFNQSKLQNIFTGRELNDQDDLALMIYSTFLMTKAPYQRAVERSSNLKGILKIHELYLDTVGVNLSPAQQLQKISVTCEGDLGEYSDLLFSNDFCIDPKYCALVGNFVDSILVNQGDSEDIQNSWVRIINSTWDDMATSTGLRGVYNEVEDFWGQKGYFVIYKELFTRPDYSRTVVELFNSNMTDDSKRKLMRDLNKSFLGEGLAVEQEFLLFHAVDKVQWRGGREIYVMDMATKTLQQPIEKFMAELCKKLDNELISIPSDRRAQVIHHSIFEKDIPTRDTLTWYLTLDCTKWAPKSVFVKFAIMLLNMSCIPSSFTVHFLNYIEKLYKKRIYFNNAEVEVLMNNILYKDIVEKHLQKDNNVGGYYLLMPYSWVMGIFNYTSSFMHAANQKYFSYILLKTSIISFKEETTMVMFAHSDDSGGRLTAPNLKMASRALVLYELSLKSCNHLLSKKKSVVSRIYFEILSVIYLFKQLLALLPKFLGGIRFLPTDKGPSQDMLQSYSKCIEVMIAGANFSIAYLVMKIYSTMIWRFYTSKTITPLDYNRPVQYFGMPDAHPLLVLLCGSDADLMRLMLDPDCIKGLMAFCKTVMVNSWDDGPIKPLKFEIKVRGIKRGLEDYLELFKNIIDRWSIRNVNYHSTVMNSLSFLRKLNDSGFVGSLVNESVTRRLSRSYFMRSGNSLITKLGNIKFDDFLNAVTLLQLEMKKGEVSINLVLKEILGEIDYDVLIEDMRSKMESQEPQFRVLEKTLQSPIKICKYMDSLSMEGRKLVESHRTLKPTLVQLSKTAQVFSVNFDPASLVSYMKEPDLRWALKDLRNLITAEHELINFCERVGLVVDKLEPDDLLRMCRTYGRENTKSIYLYSRVPTELRQIKSFSAFLTFISVNSFHNKEIQGLVLKLQNKELGKDYLETNVNEDVYLINNCISLISILIDKCDLEFTKSLSVKPIGEVNWNGGCITEFALFLRSWEDKDVHYTLLKPQVEFLLYKLGVSNKSCERLTNCSYYTFLKSQKVKNGWFGKGEVYIHVASSFFTMILDGSQIKSVSSNFSGRLNDLTQGYITDVLINLGLDIKSLRSNKAKPRGLNSYCFGFDNVGRMCILPSRECESGVPCTFIAKRGGFVDNLEYYCFKEMYKDHLIIESEFEGFSKREKLYFLPIKRAEIVPLISRLFDKSQFSTKLKMMGLNDFEEFIMTELMTEYGTGLFVDFEEMLDNYSSSKLYDIFKKVKETGISSLPKGIKTSVLPAPEGSLMRILIDYSESTQDRIVNIPSTLNPIMMQLRSEYPESMSVLLSEKLVEYHSKIYSVEEIKEISDHYSCYTESEDKDEVRSSLIKLMTYWGYGGLVNSLESFTLVRDNRNYSYFDGRTWDKRYISHYHLVFITLINSIIETINHFSPNLQDLKLSVPQLRFKNLSVETVINEFVKCICLELYKFSCLNSSASLPVLNFNNLVATMMESEEFCSTLQLKISRNYILGSLPVNPKNKNNFLILMNNLRNSWCKNNRVDHLLRFDIKLERLPANVPNPRQFMSSFTHTIPARSVYNHGALPGNLLLDIMTGKEIEIGKSIYRVNFVLSEISDVRLPLTNLIKFERPLRGEVLDSEEWEELSCELAVEDLDEETIAEIWESIDNPYVSKSIKRYRVRGKQIFRVQIKVIIDVMGSSRPPNYSRYRQTGENLIILSTSYSENFIQLGNNVNIKVAHNKETPPIFIYTMFSDEINNKQFIDRVVPGDYFTLPGSLRALLHDNTIRDSDGVIKKTVECGFKFDEEFSFNREIVIDEDGTARIADKGYKQIDNEPSRESVEKSQYEIIMNEIECLKEKGLMEGSIKKLKDKYFKKAVKSGLPLDLILQSVLKEGELMLLHQDIKAGALELAPAESLKTFLAPESFGAIVSGSRLDNKSIRDQGVRAEIDSFVEGLSDKIGSCTLNVSNKFLTIIKSNYKLWRLALRASNIKKENKNHFLSLFLTLITNANKSNSEDDDFIWQTIINKGATYLAQDDESESEDEDFEALFRAIPASRLKYRAKG
jgi:hypothetical protein